MERRKIYVERRRKKNRIQTVSRRTADRREKAREEERGNTRQKVGNKRQQTKDNKQERADSK